MTNTARVLGNANGGNEPTTPNAEKAAARLEEFGREVLGGEYPMDSASGQEFVDVASLIRELEKELDRQSRFWDASFRRMEELEKQARSEVVAQQSLIEQQADALKEIAEGAYTWDEHLEIASAALSQSPSEERN
jgi:hypothetical protein